MMNFLNPYFLVALLGAGVPIALHLMTRDRIQHASFSTLRFFAKSAKLVVRRKKYEELTLLLIRAALCALLALIFARPYFGTRTDGGSSTGLATARVIVIDVSGSMRRPGLADALKKEAAAALDSLREGQDGAAIITFNDTATVQSPLSDKLAAAKGIASGIAPGYGGTNIAEALRKADELLRGVPAKQKEIVLISDFQRQGWSYFKGDWKLGSDLKLTIDSLKATGAGAAFGIVDLSAPSQLVLDKQPGVIAVRVANFTDKPQTDVPVTLMLNGQKMDEQKINLRPHGKVGVRFRHAFDTPGDNPGSVVVGTDRSTPDNTVYFNAHTIPKIPVLVVNGRPSVDLDKDAAYFLRQALAPGDDSPFAVTMRTTEQVSPQDITAAAIVLLANVGAVSAPVAGALSARVNNGGGLFFLPGDQVKADSFNAQFGEIAPCRLRQILDAHPTNGDTAESLTHIEMDHPIFDVFAAPHHGDLSLPKFAHYWETSDTQLSHVLARFGDGRPAIVERQIGKGVSLALVSAIDPSWNDFARQSVFLPFVHQAARYLAVQTGQPTVFATGDLLPVPEGDTLKNPQGQVIQPATVNGTKASYYADQPGLYLSFTPQGTQDFCFAVNGSYAEGDPATISADEITSAVERAPDEISDNLNPASASGSKHLEAASTTWWWILAGTLTLSLAELYIGNKTLRH